MTAEPIRPDGDALRSETRAPTGLLDVLGVAAVVLDADGRIVLWSPQAEELFGYTAREALGAVRGAAAGPRPSTATWW